MFHRYSVVFTFVIVTLILHSSDAYAGEFAKSETDDCKVVFHGRIEKGDTSKLDEFNEVFNISSDLPGPWDDAVLCLNSPGGAFTEGVKIATRVAEVGITTVIRNGDSCLSSCSTIFMAGRYRGREYNNVSRRLHVSGKLGFHRPALELGSRDTRLFDRVDVERSFNIALDSMNDLLSLALDESRYTLRPPIELSLIRELISHRGNNFVVVDNIGMAARWNIDLFGYQSPSRIGEEQVRNACENYGLAIGYEGWGWGTFEIPSTDTQQSEQTFKLSKSQRDFGRMSDESECTVTVTERSDDSGIRVCGSSVDKQFESLCLPLGAFVFFAPNTRLSDLESGK